MGTCANVLGSSEEGAAAVCQANQKIKKIVLQTCRGHMHVRPHVCKGDPGFGQSRGSPSLLAGWERCLPAPERGQERLCSPSVLKSPLPKTAFIPRAAKSN